MLNSCRNSVNFNKLYFFSPFIKKKKANFEKNLISKYVCPLYFSTSYPCYKQPYFKATLGDMTQERDINEDLVKALKAFAKDPRVLKHGLKKVSGEFVKYYHEHKEKLKRKEMYFDEREGEIDIFFKFETEEELKRFFVNTDNKIGGYSTAQFKITENKTGLFYGNVSTELPKEGNHIFSGYTNIMSSRPIKSFGRPSYHDWSLYTHLVLKIRGDGRTYSVLLSTPEKLNITWNDQYAYPLYTRGGPYWQITKIPFSHFIMGKKTRIQKSFPRLPRNMISRFGITLADSYDGPFKLEIDYIGLEKIIENFESPYENYYFRDRL